MHNMKEKTERAKANEINPAPRGVKTISTQEHQIRNALKAQKLKCNTQKTLI